MKKVILILLSVTVIAFFYYHQSSRTAMKTVKTKIGREIFVLEVADNDQTRSTGLSNRLSLAKNSGMLFIFDRKDRYSFWMKEMNFPIDFIWVDGDVISDLNKNIPPPEDRQEELELITPRLPIDKVIEVKSGTVDRLKLTTGGKIEFVK